ncbi:MAG: hypothetical protein WA874_11095 [Chryseosolibacter sp.]
MNLKLTPVFLLSCASFTAFSQANRADTVIIPLAEESKIIFTVGDPQDLKVLQHYDFQELFDDLIQELRKRHAIDIDTMEQVDSREEKEEDWSVSDEKEERREDGDDQAWEDEDDDTDLKWEESRRGKIGQTWQSYNIDLGTNNYLSEDQFPDGSEAYAVRPWGSWYVAGNSVQRTRLARNLFVEWALGVSWYSFKFQEDNMMVQKEETGVSFVADSRNVDYIKSKLSATFINASLVPVLDFGNHSRKHRVWEGNNDGFRFGIGPYVGYRVSSKSKLVYEEGGEREKEKNRDNFYLNNLRYGFRLQIGVRSTDLFVNYDMNDLFAEGKGPELNAISFGLIF